MTSKYQNIDFQQDGDIAVIRLARPDKRNALNSELVLALKDLFQNLPNTARAKVTISAPAWTCRNCRSAMRSKA